MRKTITTVVSASLFLFVGLGTAIAEDEESDEPKARPVETWTCDYIDGKGPADLDAVIAEWNNWMDDNGQTNYFAATLTPQYFGERLFDVGWLGVWADGNAMGAGTDLWVTEGGEIGAKYFEVLDCNSHSSFVSLNVKKPPQNDDESDISFVLNFSNCSIEDDKTFDEFMAAQESWNAYADENGFSSGTWIWFPIAGETNNDYDFKYIVSTADHTTSGANWQLFSEGHWRKSEELFDDLLDCDISRVYDATVVRSVASDDD